MFEIIYYTAVRESAEMARTDGVCEAHASSPASEGRLSPDLWGVNAVDFVSRGYLDWDDLRAYVRENGMRNTLLVALMPTATTSIIMGSCAESIEPVYSHIYTRRLLSGETICVNRHLQSHLKKLGLWSSEMLAKIIAHNGLIGGIEEIPADVRHLFRTVWEISLRCVRVSSATDNPLMDVLRFSHSWVWSEMQAATHAHRGPRTVHRPRPVDERVHAPARRPQVDDVPHARLEPRRQDVHVLSPPAAGAARHAVCRVQPRQRNWSMRRMLRVVEYRKSTIHIVTIDLYTYVSSGLVYRV